MTVPLNFKEEEINSGPSKADELNRHNRNLSKLLREQQFFQTQGNDYMVDKLQVMIEREVESAQRQGIIP